MSYQMSRIRGADAYRLLVTRATNLENLSAWLGVDKEHLLEANPWLQTDELEQGQELLVMASYVHLQFPDGAVGQMDEATDGDENRADAGEEDAYQDSEADAAHDEATYDQQEAEAAPPPAETVVQDAEAQEYAVSPDQQAESDASHDVQDGSEAKAEAPSGKRDADTQPIQAREPQRNVTWKPFPKSVL